MLGMSVSTLRRREGTEITPRVGPDGVHLFDETEVRAISVKYRSASPATATGDVVDGALAADVFGLLDEGVGAVDVVKRLRVHPDTIEALHGQWARMRGSIVLSRAQLNDIAEDDGYAGAVPIRDAQTLIASFKASADQARAFCMVCTTEGALLCVGCASRRNAAPAASAATAAPERPREPLVQRDSAAAGRPARTRSGRGRRG